MPGLRRKVQLITLQNIIFMSPSKIVNDTNSSLIDTAKKIGSVIHPDVSFLHPSLKLKAPMFYAVTTKTGEEEENLILKEGQSFIKLEPSSKKRKRRKRMILK